MKKSNTLITICISGLFAFIGCNVVATTSIPLSTPIFEPKEMVTQTVEFVENTIAPTEIAKPSETAPPLPTFGMPPTPVPPSEEWLSYTYSDTGLSFQYPANWSVYGNGGEAYISVTNFQLDGMQLKGQDDKIIKLDIAKAPNDISEYPSLAAYLESKETPSPESPAQVISQIELVHEIAEYEVVRQTHSGLEGQADLTYEIIYVSSKGRLISMVVYGKRYVNIAERIACTLIFP